MEFVSTGLDEGQGNGSITEMLAEDHRRLERLLDSAVAGEGHVERESYDRFRGGLLRHIGMEEKILLRCGSAAAWGRAASHREQTPARSWGDCRPAHADSHVRCPGVTAHDP